VTPWVLLLEIVKEHIYVYAYVEQKARLILAGNNHDTKMAKMLLHFTRKI
jgi:hypothetical protein